MSAGGGLNRRRVIAASTALLGLAACATPAAVPPPAPPAAPQHGLYELRIYTAAPEKMDALEARFRDHTIGLFRRHGMAPIGFWRTIGASGEVEGDRLFYLMGYMDRAARDASWRAFAADPEWRQVYADSQRDGSLTSKIENQFLAPAEYSPKLDMIRPASDRVFELRTYAANPGKLENIHARFRDHTRRIFEKHGMTNVLYWRPTEGQPHLEGKMVYLLAFPSVEVRNQAWRDFAADPEWQKVSEESQRDGQLLAARPESVMLSPTDYSALR